MVYSPKRFSIVLHAPEIPGNTGSLGRTCIALNIRLVLIRPYGFDLSEKAVRRAGLDYWKHVNLTEYDSFDQFLEEEKPERTQLSLFTKKADKIFFQEQFKEDHFLIFGSETQGLPREILDRFEDRQLALPIFDQRVRSLNLSNVATAAAYECLRQLSI